MKEKLQDESFSLEVNMFDFNKAPKDALSYLQDKGYKLSFNYDEMQRQEHNHAFTVAKVTRLDLLNDIHNSLIAAMEKGTPFEQWKRELKPTLQKYGWYGKTEVTDPKTGEVKTINVDSRRLATIYNTNMRVAYAKGRYDQMMALPDSEYWRYVAILDGMTRPTHRALNGIILHRSDPFWKLNFPPNDWGCRCIVRAYSRAVIQAKGWKIHDGKNLPAGYAPHPDWAYNVGEGYSTGKLKKMELDKSTEELPKIVKDNAMRDVSDDVLKAKFFEDIGIKEGGVFIDKVGDPTVIDYNIFSSVSGFTKLRKRDRHLYISEFASVIKEPDEIWLELEKLKKPTTDKTHRLVKKFFKYYENEKSGRSALMAVFEYLADKTQGVTLYFVESATATENKRIQKLIYRKD